ncbi:alpha/beta hydrolase [uncultured Schumannella sp.]|uniref:alpha/beta hydrolase n=1 Tax=uncultured Schumannella sp. TaxID=1195956 RepID=UPI0025E890A2|nr:alpha/beta fold hydrolase [uncultured Schumannella sp.]
MQLDSDAVIWSRPEAERAGTPLLVLLHGLGSHEGDLFSLAPYLPTEFTIAAVRAPLPEPPGFAWFPRHESLPLEERVESAAAGADAFAAWLAEASAEFSSVGLLGFSQGAMVSLLTVRRNAAAADYVVALSGGAFPRSEPADAALAAQRPPVFFGYGLDDVIVPRRMFEYTATWLDENTQATVRSYRGLAHSISDDELEDITSFLRARL